MAKQLAVSERGNLVDLRYHKDNPEPITRANCETVNNFEHRHQVNSDGSPVRARRNGKTKVWKTRPDEFQIPVKYGLYAYFYITRNNAHEWIKA